MVNKQDPNRDNDAIAPLQVNLNAHPHGGQESARLSLWRQHPLAAAGLLLSLAALVAVIFILPGLVSPVPVSAPGSSASDSTAASETSPARGPSESPWQDAQFAKARREAQTVLQKMLERQEALEKIHVEQWAREEYRAALVQAESADQHYQRQEFTRAQSLYQDSLNQMEALLRQSRAVFQSALRAGEQAIEQGNARLAREQFQLAAYIQADSEAVKAGLSRAAVLEDVLAEIDAGKRLQRAGQLAAARERYQAALKLDQQSRLAQSHLAEIQQAIADQNFGRHMSEGFAAMSAGKHPEAIAAFENALKIRPQAADAQAALTQARNESTQTRLQALLQQARDHEREEQWQAALDRYQEALKVDANLVEARVGAMRAGTRADIDRNLETILASPERLTTPAVHQDYQAFYEETSRISRPGPRLQRQLAELEEALRLAVQPVTVRFRSDNATQVTLFRVAQLGSFEQTELTLKPGTYTLVGTRPGYRDVRQQFTVAAGHDRAPVITIQCEEKISEG